MNLFADIRGLVISCLDAMVADGTLPDGLAMGAVTVEPPRDASHGDMATNAAMVLAKPANGLLEVWLLGAGKRSLSQLDFPRT